jgi:hypothetical protein
VSLKSTGYIDSGLREKVFKTVGTEDRQLVFFRFFGFFLDFFFETARS